MPNAFLLLALLVAKCHFSQLWKTTAIDLHLLNIFYTGTHGAQRACWLTMILVAFVVRPTTCTLFQPGTDLSPPPKKKSEWCLGFRWKVMMTWQLTSILEALIHKMRVFNLSSLSQDESMHSIDIWNLWRIPQTVVRTITFITMISPLWLPATVNDSHLTTTSVIPNQEQMSVKSAC